MFSVEPGIYLEGETGVRIEDLVLFDAAAGRVERLTHFPREPSRRRRAARRPVVCYDRPDPPHLTSPVARPDLGPTGRHAQEPDYA